MRKMICTAVAALFMVACGTSTEPDPGAVEWTTDLQAEAGFEGITGEASVGFTAGETSFSSIATIEGATEGAVHPWHVHVGQCGDGGEIVGDPNGYPPLEPGADGSDTQTATINAQLDADADYYVNVHASPDDLGTIVACGTL